ncbi:hypothetical protein MAM1_0322c09661 [Mucor ambiguus]|uniref:Uncharacterized protein n=1 Tax=Mucor ambiguus TaxID=91626 RepID=A0A0C9LXJ1_9FUNG|nr:hypothetical protein MAM1_0322c09661 [Mucor ambiguus]
MADLNWCTFCDNAVSPFSESLYCSEQCLRADALRNHPLLGYTYPEFTDFPRPNNNHHNHNHIHHDTTHQDNTKTTPSSYSNYSSASVSPALTATSSHTSGSSIQLSSPPKFDLLSNSTCLPPITTTTTAKPTHFNYFSIFDTTTTA